MAKKGGAILTNTYHRYRCLLSDWLDHMRSYLRHKSWLFAFFTVHAVMILVIHTFGLRRETSFPFTSWRLFARSPALMTEYVPLVTQVNQKTLASGVDARKLQAYFSQIRRAQQDPPPYFHRELHRVFRLEPGSAKFRRRLQKFANYYFFGTDYVRFEIHERHFAPLDWWRERKLIKIVKHGPYEYRATNE